MQTINKSSAHTPDLARNPGKSAQVEALKLMSEIADSLSQSTRVLSRKLAGDRPSDKRRK